MSENSNLPEPIKELFARNGVIQEFQQQLDRLSRRGSDELENQILVDLWRDLGDQTQTYWQAMTAVQALVKSHDTVTNTVGPLAAPVKARLYRALGAILLHQAGIIDQIGDLEAERDRKLAAL